MAQLVTRVDEDLVEAIDALVEAGVVRSRSEAVRMALHQLVDHVRRRQIGEQIVAGYLAIPQTNEELGGIDRSTAEMIAEEPW